MTFFKFIWGNVSKMRETNVTQICCFAAMTMPYIKIHYANGAAQGSRKIYSRMKKYILFFPVPAAVRAQLRRSS